MDFQASDKHKQEGMLKDKDSIRASILDEAVIVYFFYPSCSPINFFALLRYNSANKVGCCQVFSTLSFSGSALFGKLNRGFDVVIIDEAAQAVSSLSHELKTCLILLLINTLKQ